jgi:hypothetical protein
VKIQQITIPLRNLIALIAFYDSHQRNRVREYGQHVLTTLENSQNIRDVDIGMNY